THVRWADVRAIALAAAFATLASCVTPPTTASPSPSAAASATIASASPIGVAGGLDAAPVARALGGRRWYTVPDGLVNERVVVGVEMAQDAAAGQPRARLRAT